MTRTDVAYRKTAVEGASGFGLLIALYDTLAGNLRRAAGAQRVNDIETRCREVKHAFTVIGYLENCVRGGPGGQLAGQLSALYASLRRKIMDAQVDQSAEALEQQMEMVLKIREQWQILDLQSASRENPALGIAGAMSAAGTPAWQTERRSGGWSG